MTLRASVIATASLVVGLACSDDGGATPPDTGPGPTSGEVPPTTGDDAAGSSSDSGPVATSDGTSVGSTDAGPNTDDTTAMPICGDGLCDLAEDATSCCEDCGVCAEDAVVRMETGVVGGVPGGGLVPGGMADTHAQFAGGSFSQLEFPFTIEQAPVDGSSWFWAQQFFFENTTQGGYLGLQSNGILGGATVGKMAIFSIWDATEAMPGPGDAACEPFGGEGVGYSCRLPFAWRQNVTYRLTLIQTQPAWWSVSLHDPTDGVDHLLGTIHAPDAWGLVRPPTAGFAEYYGAVESCETLPHAVALLHQPSADGTAPTLVDAGTYGTCMAQASSVCTGALCG